MALIGGKAFVQSVFDTDGWLLEAVIRSDSQRGVRVLSSVGLSSGPLAG